MPNTTRGAEERAVRLTVYGVAAPQGSKRHVGGGRMVESSKKLKPWRESVSAAAQGWCLRHRGFAPFDEPLALAATFYLPRPKTAPKRVLWPAKTPDADKLARGICDALTGIIYADDARIVRLIVEKRFAVDAPPRVEITIAPIGAEGEQK